MDFETDKQWFSASSWLAVSLGVPKDQVIFIRTFYIFRICLVSFALLILLVFASDGFEPFAGALWFSHGVFNAIPGLPSLARTSLRATPADRCTRASTSLAQSRIGHWGHRHACLPLPLVCSPLHLSVLYSTSTIDHLPSTVPSLPFINSGSHFHCFHRESRHLLLQSFFCYLAILFISERWVHLYAFLIFLGDQC